ncbi:MAG: hypothetical protein AAFZ58_09245 [Pseudomonadota bacterium]
MSSNKKEFYVGYLPTPPGLVRFYRLLVPVIIVAAGAFGFWLAGAQQAVGEGQWAYGIESEVTGLLQAEPYPHVITADGDAVLLVREGKLGVQEWAKAVDNQTVAVSGYAIDRGSWRMLELRTEADITRIDFDQSIDVPSVEDFGSHTLSGEIVDSKCFLGVMKPGEGRVHRACAELCIRGGMPPMLMATDTSGITAGYVLLAPDGGSAIDLVAGKVAVPVTLEGQVTKRGSLRYLTLADDTIDVLASVRHVIAARSLCTL